MSKQQINCVNARVLNLNPAIEPRKAGEFQHRLPRILSQALLCKEEVVSIPAGLIQVQQLKPSVARNFK